MNNRRMDAVNFIEQFLRAGIIGHAVLEVERAQTRLDPVGGPDWRSRPTGTAPLISTSDLPEAPAGLEALWIQTFHGKRVYPMFRIYYPKPGLFDGSWKLPDVELVK
jgi:hypothetical protein